MSRQLFLNFNIQDETSKVTLLSRYTIQNNVIEINIIIIMSCR